MALLTQSQASSPHFVSYTSLAADKNLLTDGPNYLGTPGIPCRQIICISGGILQLTRMSDGATVTTPILQAGQVLNVQAKSIIAAGTTATSALVLW